MCITHSQQSKLRPQVALQDRQSSYQFGQQVWGQGHELVLNCLKHCFICLYHLNTTSKGRDTLLCLFYCNQGLRIGTVNCCCMRIRSRRQLKLVCPGLSYCWLVTECSWPEGLMIMVGCHLSSRSCNAFLQDNNCLLQRLSPLLEQLQICLAGLKLHLHSTRTLLLSSPSHIKQQDALWSAVNSNQPLLFNQHRQPSHLFMRWHLLSFVAVALFLQHHITGSSHEKCWSKGKQHCLVMTALLYTNIITSVIC